VSGFRVTWDSSRQNGERVVGDTLLLTRRIAITTILPNKSQGVLMVPLLSIKEVVGCTRLFLDNTKPKDTMAITP